MKRISLLVGIMIVCCVSMNAQQLRLSNGTTQRVFDGGYLQLRLVPEYAEDDCCDFTDLSGSINWSTADSISLKLDSYYSYRQTDNIKSSHTMAPDADYTGFTIATKDILYLSRYKSKKSKKRKEVFQIIGGVLMVTGVVTAVHALAVDGSNNKNTLLISGGAQFVIGFTMGLSATNKDYYLKDKDEVWTVY